MTDGLVDGRISGAIKMNICVFVSATRKVSQRLLHKHMRCGHILHVCRYVSRRKKKATLSTRIQLAISGGMRWEYMKESWLDVSAEKKNLRIY